MNNEASMYRVYMDIEALDRHEARALFHDMIVNKPDFSETDMGVDEIKPIKIEVMGGVVTSVSDLPSSIAYELIDHDDKEAATDIV